MERLKEIRKYTDHSIQACHVTEVRGQVQQTLSELESVCTDLQQQINNKAGKKVKKENVLVLQSFLDILIKTRIIFQSIA